ncbi:MAG: 16S rRNA (guanine(527)-N(7))-methyltransferase RsmG [Bdellovibrio sp.]|nr:MAG: 16S rRNA (guanine(527)-N(7))-methyltransferase RsmG [Bdellovibrio sp.]
MSRHKKPQKIYPLEEANDRLYDIFKNHGFANFPHNKRKQLAQFYILLMQQQTQENFTRLIKFRDIAIKHFIDSLMIPRLVTIPFPLLDIGTGPGFPGIPLKIQFPEKKIILAEKVRKRVEFLKRVKEEMQLSQLDIIGHAINSQFALPCQSVITRAVEPIHKTLNRVSQCLSKGGLALFMKGPHVQEEIEEAQKHPLFSLKETIKYQLPLTPHQRTLVVFQRNNQ